jgi:hypothetical protein
VRRKADQYPSSYSSTNWNVHRPWMMLRPEQFLFDSLDDLLVAGRP